MAFPGSLQQALSLPLQNAAAAGAAAVGSAVSATIAQAISAVGLPTSAQKQAEVLNKLKSTGTASGFTAISPAVGISNQNGVTYATSSSTGKALVPIGTSQENQLPAALAQPQVGDRTMEFKVQISSEPSFIAFGDFLNNITFNVMPTIAEARSASYKSFAPIHHPGEILKYESTASRTWSINTKLITRTIEEATHNLQIINTIRSWVMPFYGTGTESASGNVGQFLGAPPPILTLKAYGDRMIGPVKCVLESYSWDWPNDCDYLPTEQGVPFPVIVSISLSLKEAWSPAEFSNFNILEYRKGNLPEAFSKIKADSTPNSTPQRSVPSMTAGDVARMDRSQAQAAEQPDGWVPTAGE